jgi:hypothetical protein
MTPVMPLAMSSLGGENYGVSGDDNARAWLRWRLLLPVILIGTPIAQLLGLLIGWQWLLPLLGVAPFYPLMVLLLRADRRRDAVLAGLLWALVLGVSGTTLCIQLPERASTAVWNGQNYRVEMSRWLETGEGRESDPAQFLPQHILHAGIFAVLCLATGGLAGMLMGAALMHYMSFYVAWVVLRNGELPDLPAALAGWHPWAVVRVASFVILGVALSEPLLRRIANRFIPWRQLAPWILAAFVGLLVDIGMKWALADAWRQVLFRVSGP